MIDHRAYGQTRDCKGCRYWSEMIARAECGDVEALCLSQDSPMQGEFTRGNVSCLEWASGNDGAIDEPGADPQRYESTAAQPKE